MLRSARKVRSSHVLAGGAAIQGHGELQECFLVHLKIAVRMRPFSPRFAMVVFEVKQLSDGFARLLAKQPIESSSRRSSCCLSQFCRKWQRRPGSNFA